MEENEKILYHYTSLEGLLGIIESKSIWATNVLYLNDASELNYSIKLLREEFNNVRGTMSTNANWLDKLSFIDRVIENINEFILHPLHFGFFICSFSEEKDLLSQWRGYCPGDIGFSVGIKLNKLNGCVQKNDGFITRCNYNENDHRIALRKIIEDILNKYDNEIKRPPLMKYGIEGEDKLSIDLLLKIVGIAPIYKHQKFEAEKE